MFSDNKLINPFSKRIKKQLIKAYMNHQGFSSDVICEENSYGDWLGLGDPINVAEVSGLNNCYGLLSFRFAVIGDNGLIIIKESIIPYEKNAENISFDIGEYSFSFYDGDDTIKLYPLIEWSLLNCKDL